MIKNINIENPTKKEMDLNSYMNTCNIIKINVHVTSVAFPPEAAGVGRP